MCTDKFNTPLFIGDSVCILHKKYATTTPTLQKGIVKSFPRSNRVTVAVNGLNDTTHTATSVIKLQTTNNYISFNPLNI